VIESKNMETGGMSKRVKTELCPLFRREENHIHIILICSETQRWREMVLNINENICFENVTICAKTTE